MTDWRDVDLQSNPFLIALQSPQSKLYPLYTHVAASNGLVLIPPTPLLPKSFDTQFAKQHILLPRHVATPAAATNATDTGRTSDAEVPTPTPASVSLWQNLCGQLVQITDGLLYVAEEGHGDARARICMEELHYTEDFQSFRVLCLDGSMSGPPRRPSIQRAGSTGNSRPPLNHQGSSTAHLTGSTARPEQRSLSTHRDVLTRVLGEIIATKCIFASPRLDFFFTDFSLAWLTVVARQPEKAAQHIQAACARCMAESIAAIKQNPRSTSSSNSGASPTTSATAKSLAAWTPVMHAELEIAIQCHVMSCLHAKVFQTITKMPAQKLAADAFAKTLAALGPVSLFDVGVSPHLVGLCDPRPAVEQMKLLGSFVTPLERLACLQKVEALLLDSMTQSQTQRRDQRAQQQAASPLLIEKPAKYATLGAPILSSNSSPKLKPVASGAAAIASGSASPNPSPARTPARVASVVSSPILTAALVAPASPLRGGFIGASAILNHTSLNTPGSMSRSRSSSFHDRANSTTAVNAAGEAMARLDIGAAHAATPASPGLALSPGASPAAASYPSSPRLSLSSSAATTTAGAGVGTGSTAASILAAAANTAASGDLHPPAPLEPLQQSMSASPPPMLPTASPGLAHAASADPHGASNGVPAALAPSPATLSPSFTPQSRPRRKSSTTGPVSVSADDLLPLVVYVLLEARPAHVHANILYMRHFSPQAALLSAGVHSELQYRLANFEAAVGYIESGRLAAQMAASSSAASAKAKKGRARPRMSSISVASTQTLHLLLTPVSSSAHRSLFRRETIDNGTSASGPTSRKGSDEHAAREGAPTSAVTNPDRVAEGDESVPVGSYESVLTDSGDANGSGEHSMFDADVEGVDSEDDQLDIHLNASTFSFHPEVDGIASDTEVDFSASVARSAHRLRTTHSADPISANFAAPASLQVANGGSNGISRVASSNQLFVDPLDEQQGTANLPAWLTDDQPEARPKNKRSTMTDAGLDHLKHDASSAAISTSSTRPILHGINGSVSDDHGRPPTHPLPVPLVPLREVLDEDPLGAISRMKKK